MSTLQNENCVGSQVPVLDPTQLALLMEMGDDGDSSTIKEIATQFVADITSVMARIDAATGTRDFAQIVKAAHTIKGSAATFGLHQLEVIARELEACAKDATKHESVPAVYESLRGAFATGREALAAYFAAR